MRFVEAVESALGPEGAAPPAAERTVRLAPAEIPHRQPPTAAAPAPAPRAATGGAAAPKAGARVPGYELLRRLGEGGMADVHLARRAEDGLEVALKILQLEGQEDVTLLRRFMREYSLLARLTHPNVVHIYERAFARDFAYIAMEYFPAGDLAGRIQRGVGTDTAVSYLRQIAAGLGAAHALGIVHRDIKPGNILFRDEQRLAIVDFGISRATDQSSSMSMACALLGTPAYMSPEQVRGGEADVRSDLYSVGVVFYEMLTGRKPFQAAGLGDLLDAHLYAPPPRLHAELARLQPVLDGLLAKDPDERFQSTEELLLGVDWDE
jgi:serine/threonine protein kinase